MRTTVRRVVFTFAVTVAVVGQSAGLSLADTLTPTVTAVLPTITTALPSVTPIISTPAPTDTTSSPSVSPTDTTSSPSVSPTDTTSSPSVSPTDTTASPTDTTSVPTDSSTTTISSTPSGSPTTVTNPAGPPASGKTPKARRPHPHKPITTVHALHIGPHPKRSPWPITLTIKTVPVLANVEFQFDGHWVTSDVHGIATVTQEHNLTSHKLVLGDLGQEDSSLKYRFTRWVGQRNPDQALLPVITGLPMRANYTIYAGMTAQYPVAAHIVTENQQTVDTTSISAITIKSDTGQLSSLDKTGSVWLDGIRPSFQRNVLSAQPIMYSLQSVMVAGTNVVDSGRQKFSPVNGDTPTFIAQFYDLTITAHDALFGSSLGRRAVVEFPDGTKRTVPFDSHYRATLLGLPRGKYQISVSADHAIVSSAGLTLSRNKTFDAPAITPLDLASLLTAALLLAMLLLVIGRTTWASRTFGRFTARGRWAGRRTAIRTPENFDTPAPIEDLLI
jgi:hypothetical protein